MVHDTNSELSLDHHSNPHGGFGLLKAQYYVEKKDTKRVKRKQNTESDPNNTLSKMLKNQSIYDHTLNPSPSII